MKSIEVLLVEDNEGDVRLTKEALKEGKLFVHLNVVRDGLEAIAFLRRVGVYAQAPAPDLILLDLNLPKKMAVKFSKKSKPTPLSCTFPS